jgi:hypothetical protein
LAQLEDEGQPHSILFQLKQIAHWRIVLQHYARNICELNCQEPHLGRINALLNLEKSQPFRIYTLRLLQNMKGRSFLLELPRGKLQAEMTWLKNVSLQDLEDRVDPFMSYGEQYTKLKPLVSCCIQTTAEDKDQAECFTALDTFSKNIDKKLFYTLLSLCLIYEVSDII